MILLKLAALALLLGSLVVASFQVLGLAAIVPVGLGIGWAVWRLRHPPDEPVPETRIHVRLDLPPEAPPPPLSSRTWPG